MRPGGLERRGLGYDRLREVNPRIVFCTISGYGMTGPYRDLPSHGIAYDTWAGIVKPALDDDGFVYMPEHASIGIHAGPLFGALGVLAGIIRARATGSGCRLEIAQSDAAAAMDWLRSESWKAYERPESEVYGNKADDYERRAPGTAGMEDGVRYQIYRSKDGHVLFMASEQAFWKNFCEGVGASICSSAGRARNMPITPRATGRCRRNCSPSLRQERRRSGSRSAVRSTLRSHPSTRRGRCSTTRSFKTDSRGCRHQSWARTCCRRRSSFSVRTGRTRCGRRRSVSTPRMCCARRWGTTQRRWRR